MQLSRRPKNLAEVINHVATGATLIKTYCMSDETGNHFVRWILHPTGHSVDAKHVDRLLELDCLTPLGDGLFPEDSQQFEWVTGSQCKFSTRTVNMLLPELQPVAA